ncbi:hypothetical protein F8388_010486 [Cannabis sativa]|uniref:Uncharacterized protein n=2 Tax=Cannabis sativa TaxID=3483 RepID=A0A7J6GU89_CANSA|nr:hypothetical protein F8388_010486 [Cannabis sativa]KAF4397341.1 hypothetical protein G4B88_027081 [Cannabis sativa]
MSKSQISNTISQNLQHEGGKNVQIVRSQNVLTTNLTKGVNNIHHTLDEFKHGFPSQGLSTVSYKWWGGTSFPDGHEAISNSKDGAGSQELAKVQSTGAVSTREEKGGNEEEKDNGCEGTGLLMDVRKKVVEEGREALKLGVIRRYGAHKLGKKEKALLLRIFKSSTLQELMNGTS